MSDEPKLAYTVHHKGRKYLAGKTAGEIGPAAAEFGDHVWEGGNAPAKSAIPSEGPDGGTYTATPGTSRSGLPGAFGGEPAKQVATALRTEGGDNTPGTPGQGDPGGGETGGQAAGDGGTPPAKKAATPAKRAGSGS